MEFPFTGLTGSNVSVATSFGEEGRSLYDVAPAVAAPYVVVLGVAAVVGTVGNLVSLPRSLPSANGSWLERPSPK